MDTLPEASEEHAGVFPENDDEEDVDDEEIDPRIQKELDALNSASTEINRLENELDEARTKYRSIVSITSNQMEAIAHDRKKSIHKAREYYRLVTESKLAQREALKAARQYQSAVGVYKAAKETVALAESNLCDDTSHSTAKLSSAWQEALNHAVARVTAAEKDKAQREADHKRRAAKFSELEMRKQGLEKKFSKSIKKAKAYFELKTELDVKLMQQKQNVTDLQAAIKASKQRYTASLRRLETISEEIHQTRRQRLWSKIPRMPGVGADTDSEASGLSELDRCSITESYDGNGDLSDDENETSSADVTFNTTTSMTSLSDACGQSNIGEGDPPSTVLANIHELTDQTNNASNMMDNSLPKQHGKYHNDDILASVETTSENNIFENEISLSSKTTGQEVNGASIHCVNTHANSGISKTEGTSLDQAVIERAKHDVTTNAKIGVSESTPTGQAVIESTIKDDTTNALGILDSKSTPTDIDGKPAPNKSKNKTENKGEINLNTSRTLESNEAESEAGNNIHKSGTTSSPDTNNAEVAESDGDLKETGEEASDYTGVDMSTVERPLPSGEE